MLSRTDWELKKELPAAVVEVAIRIAGSENIEAIEAALRKIAESGDSWVSRVARELASDQRELQSIINGMKHGLKPRDESIEEVVYWIKKGNDIRSSGT